MTISSWSFTAWESFDRCRAQFNWKYVLKVKTTVPTPEYFLKGRRVHEGLDKLISAPPGVATMPPEVQKEVAFVNELVSLHAPKVVEQKWGFAPNWNPMPWKNAWYRGICDVAIDYGDWGEVVDWKIGRRYAANDEQMNCFATMSLHRWPLWRGVTTRLVYVENGGQEIRDYYREGLTLMTEKWNARANEMFSCRDWSPQPGEYCSRCDYAKSKGGPCRYGGA